MTDTAYIYDDAPRCASQFTGKEHDWESGLDYFGARFDSSSMGRFMSPDQSDEWDPVPYADMGDPQSLNLYTYVGNNPLNYVDPDGHDALPAGQCAGWPCRLLQGIFNLFRGGNGASPTVSPEQPGPGPHGSYGPDGRPQLTHRPALPVVAAAAAAPAVAFPTASAGSAVVVCEIAEPCGIGLDTVVIVGAAVVGTAYLTRLGYIHHKEQSQIRAAARAAGITYRQFSDYLHSIKEGPWGGGRGPGDNYTYAELVALAKEAAQWYDSHK